jgi:hypothetical protein
MKERIEKIICMVLGLAIIGTLLWGFSNKKEASNNVYDDGIEQIDIDSIYLTESGVQVDLAEIIVGTQKETRKLIVSTQEATVSTKLTERLIEQLDFQFMKKTQAVTYKGTGYFVVDLDKLTKDYIIDDKKNKTLTIKIEHAYLQDITVDPEKIIIDEVKEGLLARGAIKLTVKDYNEIEKDLRKRLENAFNTVENGQTADANALQMVKAVYKPIVKAIDSSYKVNVEFK